MYKKKNHKEISPNKTGGRLLMESFRHPPAPMWSPSQAAGGSLLSRGLQGHSCTTTACSTEGIPALTPGTLLSFLLPQPWCLQSCSSLEFLLLKLLLRGLFPLFESVIPEVLPLPLAGSALACSQCFLEPAGIVSIRYRENLQQFPTEATPKPCPANPIHSPAQNRHILKALANPALRISVPFYTAQRQTVRIDGLHPSFSLRNVLFHKC